MEAAFWDGGDGRIHLPPPVHLLTGLDQLMARRWDVLAMTSRGCDALDGMAGLIGAQTLLLPGDRCGAAGRVTARQVIDVGLSPRDTLTFSSLEGRPVMLCVQRRLLRWDGLVIEPREFPLPELTLPAEETLLMWGLRLLA